MHSDRRCRTAVDVPCPDRISGPRGSVTNSCTFVGGGWRGAASICQAGFGSTFVECDWSGGISPRPGPSGPKSALGGPARVLPRCSKRTASFEPAPEAPKDTGEIALIRRTCGYGCEYGQEVSCRDFSHDINDNERKGSLCERVEMTRLPDRPALRERGPAHGGGISPPGHPFRPHVDVGSHPHWLWC
jgi:hypothetical protein